MQRTAPARSGGEIQIGTKGPNFRQNEPVIEGYASTDR